MPRHKHSSISGLCGFCVGSRKEEGGLETARPVFNHNPPRSHVPRHDQQYRGHRQPQPRKGRQPSIELDEMGAAPAIHSPSVSSLEEDDNQSLFSNPWEDPAFTSPGPGGTHRLSDFLPGGFLPPTNQSPHQAGRRSPSPPPLPRKDSRRRNYSRPFLQPQSSGPSVARLPAAMIPGSATRKDYMRTQRGENPPAESSDGGRARTRYGRRRAREDEEEHNPYHEHHPVVTHDGMKKDMYS